MAASVVSRRLQGCIASPLVAVVVWAAVGGGFPVTPAHADTMTYASAYAGGTIDEGSTVILEEGASVTGNIAVNGTLQFNHTGDLTVSSTISGTGTMALTNSGSLTLTGTTLNNTIVLDMTTNVTAGTLAIGNNGARTLRVGNTGAGVLNIDGGLVISSTGSLGVLSGGNGTATVSSGTWRNSGQIFVGSGRTGTLIVNGGRVESQGNVSVGYGSSAIGTATVSSGTLSTNALLSVGFQGKGAVNVTGGVVTSGSVTMGNFSSGIGTISVSSGTFATGRFEMGSGSTGRGVLNVEGGYVRAETTFIGSGSSASGTATVTSGTWLNTGNLSVGTSGSGVLTLNGGLLAVSGTLARGVKGTINLDAGGTLQIGDGGTTGVLDVASLTNNGTLIFDRSDASIYAGILSGSGAITKRGAGRLTLSGANDYSGLTTVLGGTLALSGSGSIGTGGLALGAGGVFDLSDAISTTFEITDPLFTTGSYDLVDGAGSVVFGGVLNLHFSGGTYEYGTDVLQLFANTGGFAGSFTSVQATGLGSYQWATFDETTGTISVVPEPSASVLGGIGLGIAGLIRWRTRLSRATPQAARHEVSTGRGMSSGRRFRLRLQMYVA